ncbi:hypothetical protein [Candidatus Sororendozoicomonas aggregata]|uniref:hypothetical protein n=1 Tax=Candidatus Sororendozoicomonas aggregata TaxID=3073239 RepID=UPI002ED5ED6A
MLESISPTGSWGNDNPFWQTAVKVKLHSSTDRGGTWEVILGQIPEPQQDNTVLRSTIQGRWLYLSCFFCSMEAVERHRIDKKYK